MIPLYRSLLCGIRGRAGEVERISTLGGVSLGSNVSDINGECTRYPPTAYCLHTDQRPLYDLFGDGILLCGVCPAESTHTAFISIISSPSTTFTSSVPVTLGLLTHFRNLSMVAGSILYSLYTLDGSDPAGNAFNRSSRDIKSGAVRWLGGGAAEDEVNSSVRALRVR
jgi:hypothetical protein